jgi:hypothetical protein
MPPDEILYFEFVFRYDLKFTYSLKLYQWWEHFFSKHSVQTPASLVMNARRFVYSVFFRGGGTISTVYLYKYYWPYDVEILQEISAKKKKKLWENQICNHIANANFHIVYIYLVSYSIWKQFIYVNSIS